MGSIEMKKSILGILASGFVSLGAAHAQVTTLNYSANIYGTEDQYQGLGSTTPPITFSGILTAQVVIDITSQGALLDSYNFRVNGLPNGLTWETSSYLPVPVVSTGNSSPYFSINQVGSIQTDSAFTYAIVGLNEHFYRGPHIAVGISPIAPGSNLFGASIYYQYGSLNGACQNGANPGPAGLCDLSVISTSPSKWTSTTQAPEIDPASAASGLTVLLGAIAVLRGRKRARY